MNIKKTLFAAVLALGFMNASAQEQETVEVFNPHWYVQAQVGGQYTIGEVAFKDLLSPNAQLGVGYNFNPVVGLRFSVNAWQSKAGSTIQNIDYKWNWKYVNPALDVTFNLTNLICGYDAARKFDVGVLGGIGANIAFSNDQANEVNAALNAKYPDAIHPNGDQWLRHLWDGTALRLSGRLGAYADYKINDKVSVGLEAQYNIVNDHYNSKQAPNPDTYYNVLAGVKINLGPTHRTKVVKGCDPVIIEKVVEVPVERVVEKIVEAPTAARDEIEPLREVIYYAIRVSDPNADDIINKVVAWCKKYPKKGVSVRGYADKGTGTPRINQGYAKKRAETIAAKLKARGIDQTRISVSSYGDTVQPFEENDKNRCVIIVGE